MSLLDDQGVGWLERLLIRFDEWREGRAVSRDQALHGGCYRLSDFWRKENRELREKVADLHAERAERDVRIAKLEAALRDISEREPWDRFYDDAGAEQFSCDFCNTLRPGHDRHEGQACPIVVACEALKS